jgi:ribosomal protein S9
MTHHAAEPQAADTPGLRAPVRLPAWRRGAELEGDVREVLAATDRLRAGARAAEEQARREPDDDRLRLRLEEAVDEARVALGEVIVQVDQLEQYALSQQRWDLTVRLRAVRSARSVDVMAMLRAGGEPTQAQLEAAARMDRALAGLNPHADDLEHGFEDLKAGLRRQQRALRDVLQHRDDRPLSLQHLRALLGGAYRTLGTVAVGLLAALGVATQDGAAPGDAAIAAATAVAASGERVVDLVRQRMRTLAPPQRMLATHDDLSYLVADFARAVAADPPDRDQLEDLYAAALLQSTQAARWAQRLPWNAKQDYAVTARQVPVVLGEAMAAVRAGDTGDPLARTAAAARVAEVHESLTRYRIPDPHPPEIP